MLRFSANLGFLWTELPLPAAIMAAAKAGFDSVECHWPFDVPSSEILAALTATKLPMLGLNTRRGNVDAGDFGLAACVGREDEARRYIDEAVDYAAAIGAGSVHVMAGRTDGNVAAETAYCDALAYAGAAAARHDMTILIEPINLRDVANYHLSTVEAGVATIKQVGLGNIKLMFDCYHIQIMQGDLIRRIEANLILSAISKSPLCLTAPSQIMVNLPIRIFCWRLMQLAMTGLSVPNTVRRNQPRPDLAGLKRQKVGRNDTAYR